MVGYQNFKASKFLSSSELEYLKISLYKKPVGIKYSKEGIPLDLIYDEDYVEDEEFEYYVKSSDYYISTRLLKGVKRVNEGDINLNMIEKTSNFLNFCSNDEGFKWGSYQRYTCGIFLWAYCEKCDCEYIVRVPCYREWCQNCGQELSLYHRRRYLKTYCYAIEMYEMSGAVGYLVITCPEELREKWKNPEELNRVVNYVERMLEREGFPCGLCIWHFAGDRSRRWYPHLNILIPNGYMNKEKLERLKKLIYNRLGVLVVHYEYAKDIKKIKHLCRYVSRPTWNLQSEVKPDNFKYFRKFRIWGKKYFKSAKIKKTKDLEEFAAYLEDLVKKGYLKDETEKLVITLLHGRCCFCYEKLKWSMREEFDLENKKIYKLGWGCWIIDLKKIENIPPPEEDYWEPGMGDADYITEEDKKLIEEMQRKEGGNEFI